MTRIIRVRQVCHKSLSVHSLSIIYSRRHYSSGVQNAQATSVLLHTGRFVQRRLCLGFPSRFLAFVAYISAGGGTSAHNAVLSCREYYNKRAETPFETKLNCVGDAVGFMLKGVGAFVAGGHAEESIREGFLGAVANGNQGRAVIDFSRLNNDINNHPQFLNSEHSVRIESVYASNVGIDNAVAYGVSMTWAITQTSLSTTLTVHTP